jgi:hypothetical protein
VKQGQGAQALPWGEAAQVNDLVGLAPPPDEPGYQPQGDQDQFLYGPSDRPQEPFSHGLPYGPGAAFTPDQGEGDDQFVKRIASQALNDPAAPKQMKQFAQRALNGM